VVVAGCYARHRLMASLRRHLSRLAIVWVLFQTAGIAVPLMAMHVDGAAVEVLCTCPGGDHATCPMHHGTPPPPAQENGRTLEDACAPSDTALLALFGAPGVLPTSTSTTALDELQDAVLPQPHHAVSHVELPDAPPPRA